MARAERPLDAGDGPLLRFAAELRNLREKAGSPAYRELSRRAHYSVGSLSDAAGGRKLPSLEVTLAYVGACDGDVSDWERRWREIAAELALGDAVRERADTDTEGSPYAGLAAFRAEDADRFFGREKLVAELCARVAEQRFVAVVGPSGSGKSSVLRAGLVHHVRTRGLLGIPGGSMLVMTPGAHPLEECAAQLAALVGTSAGVLHTALRSESRSLHLSALQVLVDQPAGTELVVVVDQFEEVFTLCRDANESARFLGVLHAAARAANSRTRVVLGIRADFYAHCAEHPDLFEVLRNAQVLVSPMSTEELRAAVTQPAVNAGCRIETALMSQVIADAVGRPGVLPLVSHAMLETWLRRRGTTLTRAGYEAAGGVTQAVARTAESAYRSLSPAQQRWSRNLFTRLVALGEGTEDTKRRVDRAELDLGDPDAGVVLERLAQARLVTLDRDSVEITHEALIRCWPQLREWLADDRDGLRTRRQLTEATHLWESLGCDPGALYRGARLDLARDLPQTGDTGLTPRERAFLAASLAAETAEHAGVLRRARRLRHLVALLAVLLALTTATTTYAVRAADQVAQRRNTLLSEKAAADAISMRTTNPALATQLALAAYRLTPAPDVRESLISTVTTPLTGHTQPVSSALFSPDGQVLATPVYDFTVRLWDVADPRQPAELATFDTGHTDVIAAAAWSADGRMLATTGRDRTVRLWDVSDRRLPTGLAVLRGPTDLVFSVAFAPDGRTLAAGGYDRMVRLWDITDPAHVEPLPSLTGHTLNIKPVAFSPDGRVLASGSDDRTVRLWDVSDPRQAHELAVMSGHNNFVDALAFSRDGRRLASGSDDHTVRLWDVMDPEHPTGLSTLRGHDDVVTSVAFSTDGRRLASGSYDRTARLWDVADPRHPAGEATLRGHTGAVNSVAFSPDGRTLATSSDDHTAQLWQTDAQRAEALACETAKPVITRDEWELHFPGLDYEPPCP